MIGYEESKIPRLFELMEERNIKGKEQGLISETK